jgi:hypothetical protein
VSKKEDQQVGEAVLEPVEEPAVETVEPENSEVGRLPVPEFFKINAKKIQNSSWDRCYDF